MSTETLIQFAPILAIIAIFYFLMIRPQQQQANRQRQMREAIKQNDTVMLNSGFEVKVKHIDDNILTVEMGEDSKIAVKVSREVVLANVSEAERDTEEKKKAEKEKEAANVKDTKKEKETKNVKDTKKEKETKNVKDTKKEK